MTNKTISVGDYIVCILSWDPEEGLIDSADKSAFMSLPHHGRLFQCVGVVDDWLIVRYLSKTHDKTFKIKSCLFYCVRRVEFEIGEKVYVKSKRKEATIYDTIWHHKDERPMYFLLFDNKKSSRRYFDEELLKSTDENLKS